jgi:hypothetical protein
VAVTSRSPLERLRKICLAFPEAHEVEAWGEPTFRVKNKLFAMYAAEGNHHGSGRPGVWIKSAHVTQDMLVRSAPDRYFAPPYVGPKGWTGAWLDQKPDWDIVADLLGDAWMQTAPKKLVATLQLAQPPKKRR